VDAFSGVSALSDSKCFAQTQLTIDIVKVAKRAIPITAAALIFTFAASCACEDIFKALGSQASGGVEPVMLSSNSGLPYNENPLIQRENHEMNATVETEEPVQPWTDEELEAMVQTLRGECYDDKPECKRKVCETICNRASVGLFGNSIVECVTAPNQFIGYWAPSRPATENDYEIARQTLEDWYANNCEPLSEWLYFVAGENRENVFRSEY